MLVNTRLYQLTREINKDSKKKRRQLILILQASLQYILVGTHWMSTRIVGSSWSILHRLHAKNLKEWTPLISSQEFYGTTSFANVCPRSILSWILIRPTNTWKKEGTALDDNKKEVRFWTWFVHPPERSSQRSDRIDNELAARSGFALARAW